MKVLPQFLLWMIPAIILLSLVANSFNDRSATSPGPGSANVTFQTTSATQGNIDPGDLEKLLELADKDLSQLTKIKVEKRRAGSASVDLHASTIT